MELCIEYLMSNRFIISMKNEYTTAFTLRKGKGFLYIEQLDKTIELINLLIGKQLT